MFIDSKTQFCQALKYPQCDLQIQCNPNQNTSQCFVDINKLILKSEWRGKKPQNSQFNSEGEKQKLEDLTLRLSSDQLLSHVQLYATPRTAAHQASQSITNSRSLLKLMSIELVMPFNHLILCRSLLLLPSVFPSIRVFSSELSEGI